MTTSNRQREPVKDPNHWNAFLTGMRELAGADRLLLTAGDPKGDRILGQSDPVSAEGIAELKAIGQVAWRRRATAIVADTRQHTGDESGSASVTGDLSRHTGGDGQVPFRSLAAIPLTYGQCVMGILAVGWIEPARDLANILQPFTAVASLAAMALNASYDSLQPSAELACLTGLTEIGRRLNQRIDLGAVLQVVLDTAMTLSEAPAAAIWLRDREGTWHLQVSRGLDKPERAQLLSIVNSLPANAESGLSRPDSPHRFYLLVVVDEVLGCLLVSRRNPFTPFERNLLRTLSQQATTAILHHQTAYYDALTGLPNEAYLTRWTTQHIRQTPWIPLGLLRVDLNDFDRLGEGVGSGVANAVLVELAKRLGQIVPSPGFVAHAAGEEFHLVLPGTGEMKHLEEMALRVLDNIRQPIAVRQHEVMLTASLGIARYPADAETSEQLQQRADLALYVARRRGHDVHVFYEPTMSKRTSTLIALETQLRRAIAGGRLHLNYQPQVDDRSGRMVGVEALARWTDEKGEAIAPGVFIPLAEATGQIVAFGDWVIRQAADQVLAWQRQGFSAARVSVNVSAVQLQRPDFTARIETILAGTGCLPSAMELEITESAVLHHPDQALSTLRDLRELGFRIAIDDFGTGWSSLNYLLDYPVDTLKIDQSFMRRVTEEPKAQAVVQTIVKLAEALGVEVVAEGVETRQQAIFLKTMGCRLWQGFWLARPLPADQVDWNRQWVLATNP